jgi:ABC-2 type transport system ATP-binding protein
MKPRDDISHDGGARIVTHHLRVTFGDFLALDLPDTNLAGKVIAVIGHNGAGKSTFIKTILNLLLPSRGTVRVTDTRENVVTPLVPEQHLAFCPEMGAVFADITVESYVKLWCRFKQRDVHYYRRAGSRYIELLSIAPLFRKLGRELSKGQRRRVQTAIGFLTDPRLFLFDEPFDGLDVQRTNELSNLIAAESGERSFVISSHRMDVVEQLADVIVVLREGKALAAGTVENVCGQLCGQSATISRVEDPAMLIAALEARYPETLVTRIGQQVSITGPGVEFNELRRFVINEVTPAASLEPVHPRLVDAMNYHLLSLRGIAAKTSDKAAGAAAE